MKNQTMYARCAECHAAVMSTRGDTPELRLDSLLTNLFNHIKRQHADVADGIAEALMAVQNSASQLILSDWLEEHKSEGGAATQVFIEEHNEAVAANILELLGIETPEDEEEEDTEDGEEDETIIGEDGEEVDTGVRPLPQQAEVTHVEIINPYPGKVVNAYPSRVPTDDEISVAIDQR